MEKLNFSKNFVSYLDNYDKRNQIKYDKKGKYEPNLSVKLPFNYNRFQTDIYSEHSNSINIFQIQTGSIYSLVYLTKNGN